jgi:hypothetical protein
VAAAAEVQNSKTEVASEGNGKEAISTSVTETKATQPTLALITTPEAVQAVVSETAATQTSEATTDGVKSKAKKKKNKKKKQAAENQA